MLTKDLIKYKKVKQKIIPDFFNLVSFENKAYLDISSKIISCFTPGEQLSGIQKKVLEYEKSYSGFSRYIKCFYKILLDEIEFSKKNLYLQRLNLIFTAQELRGSLRSDSSNLSESLNLKLIEDHLTQTSDYEPQSFLDYKNNISSRSNSINPMFLDLCDSSQRSRLLEDIKKESLDEDLYIDLPSKSKVESRCYLSSYDLMGLYNLELLCYFVKKFTKVVIKTSVNKKILEDIKQTALKFKIDLKNLLDQINSSKLTAKAKKYEFSLVRGDDTSESNIDNILSFLYELDTSSNVKIYFLDQHKKDTYIVLDYKVPVKYYNLTKLVDLNQNLS